MPVNSIKNLTLSQRVNQSFKADSNETKTDAKTSVSSDSSVKKSKLPYIAGAIVLAGMGIFIANRLHKPKSAVPKPDGKLGEELNKAAEEIKTKADDVVQEVKEKAKEAAQTVKEKVEEKVAEKIKPEAIQKEKAPSTELTNKTSSAIREKDSARDGKLLDLLNS